MPCNQDCSLQALSRESSHSCSGYHPAPPAFMWPMMLQWWLSRFGEWTNWVWVLQGEIWVFHLLNLLAFLSVKWMNVASGLLRGLRSLLDKNINKWVGFCCENWVFSRAMLLIYFLLQPVGGLKIMASHNANKIWLSAGNIIYVCT